MSDHDEKHRFAAALIAAVVATTGCHADSPSPRNTTAGPKATVTPDRSPHQSGYVPVTGGRLNYLDWGGSGPALVMIHGLGDDPHLFDDLAANLQGPFRVVAYARRGHGSSDTPTGPYDAANLVDDVKVLLDRLQIRSAHLLGWGMGGNEITAFASDFPERVLKLVYLEGGYDWSTPFFFEAYRKILAANAPSPGELRSLDAMRTWYQVTWLGDAPWSDGLEAYLHDVARPDDAGQLHPVPVPQVKEALLKTLGSWTRDYSKVQAPALALYATTFFPTERSDADLSKRLHTFETLTMGPFRKTSMERLQRELPNARVQQIPDRTHVSIGIEAPATLASVVRTFLEEKAEAEASSTAAR